MTASAIVSYDGTDNDRDALALGQLLARAGAQLSLAYVRHSVEEDPEREREARAHADALLAEGASRLGDGVATHTVISGATGTGLASLAERAGAQVVVFGSDYRTAPGQVEPGPTAWRLLEGGPVAVAIAPARLAREALAAPESIAAVGDPGDWSAQETASALADALGATLVPRPHAPAEFLVLGSAATAVPGRVALSGAARYVLETARCPVLVVPRGGRISFAPTGS